MIGALVIPSTCGSSAATRRPARPCRSTSPPSPQLARRSMPRTIEPLRRHDDTRPGRSPTALLHLPRAAGLPTIRGRPTARPTPDRCGRRSHPTATRQRRTRHPRLMDGHTFGVNIFIGHGDAQRGNGYPTSQVPVGGNNQDQPHPGPRRGAAGHAISAFPSRFRRENRRSEPWRRGIEPRRSKMGILGLDIGASLGGRKPGTTYRGGTGLYAGVYA